MLEGGIHFKGIKRNIAENGRVIGSIRISQ